MSEESSSTLLVSTLDEHIRLLMINDPSRRNPLGPEVVTALATEVERARDDDSCRVLVLTGAGSAFSAGADLAAMDLGRGQEMAATFGALLGALRSLGKPTVAMIRGPAMGGALGLVCSCHLAVAADTAVFSTPEIRLGLWPMVISWPLIACIGRRRALDLMLTGRTVGAKEALDLGLVNRVVADDELEAEAMQLARTLARWSPTAIARGLGALNDCEGRGEAEATDRLVQGLADLLAQDETQKGIQAFMARARDSARGASGREGGEGV